MVAAAVVSGRFGLVCKLQIDVGVCGAVMDILVVSSFLGAGKTTFIKELARRTGRDFVVYENEIGQADIDAQQLRNASELEVWESTENCICCSGKQDFASSVLTIANTFDPDYLVVEPTGIARLGSVLENLSKIRYEHIRLLPAITVLDALNCAHQRTLNPDVFDNQIASAATIVCSKVAHGSDDVVAASLSELVRQSNQAATMICQPWDELPDAWWRSLLHAPAEKSSEFKEISSTTNGPGAIGSLSAAGVEAVDTTDELESLALQYVSVPTPAHLAWIADALACGTFGQITRAKGVVACGAQLIRFDVVDRSWALTGAEPSMEADEVRAVFIGKALNRHALREFFVPALQRKHAEIEGHHHQAHEHEHEHEHEQLHEEHCHEHYHEHG